MTRKRILVVDDDAGFTRLLKLNLETTGRYEVRAENWAGHAVSAALEFRPDLILLDVLMPPMFGGDVAARLKADPLLAKIPIVFLTAAVRRQRVQEHGGTISGYPFLAKPVEPEEVITCIEQNLQKPATPGADGAGLNAGATGRTSAGPPAPPSAD